MADIDLGAVLEALNNKVDLPTGDSQDGIDYVVDWQRPTADNNYTWYRKYKSGWVEQGGAISQSGTATVTLPITMSDNNYTLVFGNRSGTYEQLQSQNPTTTSFQLKNANSGGDASCCWQVSGYAA